MSRERDEIMLTASGDVVLTAARRFSSSSLLVSRDFDFDPLRRLSAPRRGDVHGLPAPAVPSNIAAPL